MFLLTCEHFLHSAKPLDMSAEVCQSENSTIPRNCTRSLVDRTPCKIH